MKHIYSQEISLFLKHSKHAGHKEGREDEFGGYM